MALIEIDRGRFHYVVVIGWGEDHVVIHDPAHLPDQRVPRGAFERAWERSSNWMLLILPSNDAGDDETAIVRPARDGRPAALHPECETSLGRGITLASTGRLDEAAAQLVASHRRCPDAAAPLRELAGVRLLQRRYDEAAVLAGQALERDATDAHAWRTLGTARFLRHDRRQALEAWNQLGEPVLDLVRIGGLRRTRYGVVTGALGLGMDRPLDVGALTQAQRRLNALPAVVASRLDYTPAGDGLAEVNAVVVESDEMTPGSRRTLLASAARAVFAREVEWRLSSPTGQGEVFAASWRWQGNRPRVAMGLSVPLSGAMRGVLEVNGTWEQQAFTVPPPAGEPSRSLARTERRTVQVALSDWTASGFWWRAGAAVDRWRGRGTFAGLQGTVEWHSGGNRLAAGLTGGGWLGAGRFGRAHAGIAWRSTTEPKGLRLSGNLVTTFADAPLDLWPGAGTGHPSPWLLRAHPLLDDGVVTGPAFGRRLAQGTAEYEHPIGTVKALRVSAAGFVDAARAFDAWTATALQVDAGVGLRLRLPRGGGLRFDVARGLADASHAFSAGWIVPWPGWR